MNSRFTLLLLLWAVLILPSLSLVSCKSNDPGNVELERKLDEKNSRYQNRMDRRSMKIQARDERYDAWFDMIMQ